MKVQVFEFCRCCIVLNSWIDARGRSLGCVSSVRRLSSPSTFVSKPTCAKDKRLHTIQNPSSSPERFRLRSIQRLAFFCTPLALILWEGGLEFQGDHTTYQLRCGYDFVRFSLVQTPALDTCGQLARNSGDNRSAKFERVSIGGIPSYPRVTLHLNISILPFAALGLAFLASILGRNWIQRACKKGMEPSDRRCARPSKRGAHGADCRLSPIFSSMAVFWA